jgi:hypothetical protein
MSPIIRTGAIPRRIPLFSLFATVHSPSSNPLSRNGRGLGRGVKKGGRTERLRLFLALLALLLSLQVAAAGLSGRLDRTRIAEGETVVLTLTAPGDAAGAPDPAPLTSDFDLLDQSQSTRMSIVNGHSSTTREWQWVLAPKRAGRLSIPSLRLGRSFSEPLALEVLPAAQAAKLGEARPVLLEVEAQPQQPYVQGQVVYSVRILSRVPLGRASLSEPQAGDAVIERLGEDKQYSTYRDGRQYQVIERRYAVFPQHSGKLEIAAPVLSAQIPEQGQRRGGLRERLFGHDPFANMQSFFGHDPFAEMGGIFEQTRPVQVRGRRTDLEVRPQPAGTASPWLPAESLSLAENWSPDPPVFRIGEPVTRTLTVTAEGLTAAQLPDLRPGVPAGVKVYPDQAHGETRTQGDTLVAQKVLKIALVPSQSGELTLPEVRLHWWDTRTGKPQVAQLPARTVEVLPAAAGVSAPPPVAPSRSAQAAGEPSEPVAAARPVAAAPSPAGGDSRLSRLGEGLIRDSGLPAGYWPWLAGVLALAWFASTLLWLRARGAGPAASAASALPARPAPDPVKALAAVKRVCEVGDARAARRALLAWAAARWPGGPPQGLEALAQRLDGQAPGALRELDRVLYAGAEGTWDGASAWQRLAPSLGRDPRRGARGGRDSALPPLYPQSA